jgi:hypothetical protein
MKAFAIVWAAAVAVGGFVACSSSNSGGGNGAGSNAFPFSGPSCPAGTTGVSNMGMPSSTACNNCVQSSCSSKLDCIKTDCSDFYTCLCACMMNDTNCTIGCFTNHTSSQCSTCQQGVAGCVLNTCGSACGATLDGG